MERLEWAYVGTGWVRRLALFSDIQYTHAGNGYRIVVAQDGTSYRQPDVLAALAKMPESTKFPIPPLSAVLQPMPTKVEEET